MAKRGEHRMRVESEQSQELPQQLQEHSNGYCPTCGSGYHSDCARAMGEVIYSNVSIKSEDDVEIKSESRSDDDMIMAATSHDDGRRPRSGLVILTEANATPLNYRANMFGTSKASLTGSQRNFPAMTAPESSRLGSQWRGTRAMFQESIPNTDNKDQEGAKEAAKTKRSKQNARRARKKFRRIEGRAQESGFHNQSSLTQGEHGGIGNPIDQQQEQADEETSRAALRRIIARNAEEISLLKQILQFKNIQQPVLDEIAARIELGDDPVRAIRLVLTANP